MHGYVTSIGTRHSTQTWAWAGLNGMHSRTICIAIAGRRHEKIFIIQMELAVCVFDMVFKIRASSNPITRIEWHSATMHFILKMPRPYRLRAMGVCLSHKSISHNEKTPPFCRSDGPSADGSSRRATGESQYCSTTSNFV